jgi:hypothetical protein
MLTTKKLTEKLMSDLNLQDRATKILAVTDASYEQCAAFAEALGADGRLTHECRNIAQTIAFSIRALKHEGNCS